MTPREEWEDEEAEQQLAAIRQRRQRLEEFAARLPALLAASTGEARTRIQPLADQLAEFRHNFHLNNLDEMERLRLEIEKLARG